ncbi:hypothetical protein ABZ896_21120, partial [Streptomyces sp. NPDC047072]|uniref:hypothetical protein n=1 Tax=Streptomyces sp. NPDC047072 TaxID=3154809 RepID=UPI00340DFE95
APRLPHRRRLPADAGRRTGRDAIGLVLARVGNLRLSVGWNRGHPHVRFVPREVREALAPAV